MLRKEVPPVFGMCWTSRMSSLLGHVLFSGSIAISGGSRSKAESALCRASSPITVASRRAGPAGGGGAQESQSSSPNQHGGASLFYIYQKEGYTRP
eukprot:CAMPEP_0185497620 /NCGR_PEP_ID=MMETSP1366-20130426/19094_1 /TAXON_ID=38817 /ORGANISM="Gephyrocapsa oceanica, Strain RCC1303" /LENGTH=95 /DNA_ID=CAMNT_0028106739 /DNA_START=1080 /DNA_END=1363 /DNA_ORIENTATION=+